MLLGSFSFICLLLSQSYAQSPEALKYQAVVRDANQAPITSQYIAIRFTILEGQAWNNVVYQEVHYPTTSELGLVSLNIGEGTILSGVFADIDWGADAHFLQVEIDQNGGTNYTLLGTSPLLSVPYSLYAKDAAYAQDARYARNADFVNLTAGAGISIDSLEITNIRPSLWEQQEDIILVDTNVVGIGFHDSLAFPGDARLFVNGNVRLADASYLLGLGEIVGANGISFSGDSVTSDGPDMQIASNGRVTFEEEVGINQTFSFVDLNVRNQLGNSTVFQVEDTAGADIFEVGRGRNIGVNRITNNVTLQVRNKPTGNNNIIFNVERNDGSNVLQVQDDRDVVITGDFSVTGSKNFVMDHPLDPANKTLSHNAVESPNHVTYYDGTVQLDSSGKAIVSLPAYFEALNKDYNYQLTCIGSFAQVYISSEINNNQFTIAGGQPWMKVSWQVSATRDDPWAQANPYQAENDKAPAYQGKYYYPQGYGLGKADEIGYNLVNGEEQ